MCRMNHALSGQVPSPKFRMAVILDEGILLRPPRQRKFACCNTKWLLRESCWPEAVSRSAARSEEHTSELQSHLNLVCRLLLEKKKKKNTQNSNIMRS